MHRSRRIHISREGVVVVVVVAVAVAVVVVVVVVGVVVVVVVVVVVGDVGPKRLWASVLHR